MSENLLNDVMMEFLTPLATSFLFHCPMQGPHALARTEPPAFSKMAAGDVTTHNRAASVRHHVVTHPGCRRAR